MNNRKIYSRFLLSILVLVIALSACSNVDVVPEGASPSQTIPSETQFTSQITPSKTPLPPTFTPTTEPTSTPTITSTPVPLCYRDVFPPAYQQSAVIEGYKLFTQKNNLTLRYIYFPQNCTEESIQKDIENLFYQDSLKDDELGLFILDEWYSGILGEFYQHLMMYDFWAMGPEDYGLFMDDQTLMETNIVIWRFDRINGEGTEGNAILSLMEGMAEHEYIHTIQGRNNPSLSKMIWDDGVYRAFIERYANLGNNSGLRYRQASITMMELLQFLDGLNSQSELKSKVYKLMQDKGIDPETYFSLEYLIYDKNLTIQIQAVSGDKYLAKLQEGEVNPFFLLSLAGCGNLDAFQVLKELYDTNIAQYNTWFYSSNTDQYLPASFSELFNPN